MSLVICLAIGRRTLEITFLRVSRSVDCSSSWSCRSVIISRQRIQHKLIIVLVVFQILVSLQDAGFAISATKCVVPLLLLLGILSIWTLAFVALYRSPYEEYQAGRAHQDLGRQVIWKV